MDAQIAEFFQRDNQVCARPGKAVKFPHEDAIDAALSGQVHHPIELGSVLFAAALIVDKLTDDVESSHLCILPQFPQLYVGILMMGAGSGVNGRAER